MWVRMLYFPKVIYTVYNLCFQRHILQCIIVGQGDVSVSMYLLCKPEFPSVDPWQPCKAWHGNTHLQLQNQHGETRRDPGFTGWLSGELQIQRYTLSQRWRVTEKDIRCQLLASIYVNMYTHIYTHTNEIEDIILLDFTYIPQTLEKIHQASIQNGEVKKSILQHELHTLSQGVRNGFIYDLWDVPFQLYVR